MKKFVTKESIIIAALVIVSTITIAIIALVVSRTPVLVTITPVSYTIGDYSLVLDCFKPTGTDKKCLDDFINARSGSKTTKELQAELEVYRAQNTQIENNCHPVAHAIGRWTYQKFGNIGDAFMSCDQSCHSGCYHGVMERLFYTDAQLASATPHLTYREMEQKVPHICDEDKFKTPSQALIFQCLHGVGHAILYSLDYKLEEALKSCDLLATDYEQQSCYGGVIMENVTAYDKSKRDIKLGDNHYPCNKLDDKYKYSCYQMQTSIMTELGLNYEQMPAECDKAGNYVRPCYVSIGRDMSNFVRTGFPKKVVHVCEDLSGENQSNCTAGAAYALIDNTWDVNFAFNLCSQYKQAGNQTSCFQVSASYAENTYGLTRESLKQKCAQYAGSATAICQAAL